jgi:aminoglycoside N3'-acetyltransferase
MKFLNLENRLRNALIKSGIKKNDIVFVHADLNNIFKDSNFTLRESLDFFLKNLRRIIGTKGTVVVPAYYYEYGFKDFQFDVNKSPISKELGIFPRFIFSQKKSIRSLNPITSVVALGHKAKEICNMKTCSGYGVDTPFDILTKLNAKMLFFGVDLRYMTYVHYVEFMVGVPHRYNKLFSKPIIKNKKKINLPVSSYVRYKDFNIIFDSFGNNKKFEQAKIIKKIKFIKDYIRVVEFQKAFNFLKNKLQKNFFYLLKNKPKFKNNKPPLV